MLAIEAGEAVWIAAAATGVAALLATSVSTLSFLRFAGTAYLLYFGLQRWRHSENIQATPRAELGKVFVQGFVTQLLNLKVGCSSSRSWPAAWSPEAPSRRTEATVGAKAKDLCRGQFIHCIRWRTCRWCAVSVERSVAYRHVPPVLGCVQASHISEGGIVADYLGGPFDYQIDRLSVNGEHASWAAN
jgi:hypothetical protein